MKRVSIAISEELHSRLRNDATGRSITASELARRALETCLDAQQPRRLLAAGAGASGQGDIASRIEELLASGYERSSLDR
ncbi:MAG: hypothetical protein ABR583_06875 [Gaiellaceae bacterium]